MVEQVAIVGTSDPNLQRANILMRLNRNPVIGDKFSSRHGQKGVLSQQWPDANMPFVASTGMRWARFGHFAVIVWSLRSGLHLVLRIHGQRFWHPKLCPVQHYSSECAKGESAGINIHRPDLIINPHAFPSRMTIGMLLESLVSKAGALGGRFVDGSPFQAADGGATAQDLVQTAGDTLEANGFSRLGGGQP